MISLMTIVKVKTLNSEMGKVRTSRGFQEKKTKVTVFKKLTKMMTEVDSFGDFSPCDRKETSPPPTVAGLHVLLEGNRGLQSVVRLDEQQLVLHQFVDYVLKIREINFDRILSYKSFYFIPLFPFHFDER